MSSSLSPAIAVLVTCCLVGCQQAPTAPPTAAVAPADDPRADGDAAAKRGDWQTAVDRYAVAVQSQPNDLVLRFAYASALSHLDRHAEAMEQFTWVVERGEPSRAEVVMARQWLQQARATPVTPESPAQPQTPTAQAPPPLDAPMGLLEGKSAWPGVGPDERVRLSVHLRLNGDSEATALIRQRLNVEIGTGFTWQKVPAGRYRLLGESKGVTLWDVPIVIERDKTVNVELSPANAAVPPAAFPPRS